VKSFGLKLVASLALALALSSQAAAFVLDKDGNGHPLYWASMPVRYFLVSNNTPGGANGEAAVHNAFGNWNAASTNVSYQFGGYVAQGIQQYDRKNLVYWVYNGWPYDPTLAAATFRFYDTSNGRLLDADIVFNGERYAWSVGGSNYDIENSATHEVGHFCGLGHSPDTDATMYAKTTAGETKKRSLAADDIAGVDALYGGTQLASSGGGVVSASAGGVSSGGGGGGCSIGSSPNRAGATDLLWLALTLGAVAFRNRSKR
jgi:hypothetical protein